MALTTLQNNPDGVSRFAQGSFSGTYTAADKTVTLGWIPTMFKVINCTDRLEQVTYAGMAASNFLETAANGTVTLETDGQILINTDGTCTIVAAGGAITDNDTVIWEARG